ncbi:hypothetical protein KRM28CT15_41710 [Krasilnikovia sp. M28-CT-15]
MRWLVAAVVAVVAAGSVAALTRHRTGAAAQPPETAAVATATLERRDLSTTRKLSGSIGYGAARPLTGHRDATVTWLPQPGATIARGRQLFRANDQPVVLFYGAMPLFRPIAGRNMVGRDVRIIADNLRALGYAIGRQPPPGAYVAADRGPGRASTPGNSTDPAKEAHPAKTAAPGTGADVGTGADPGTKAEPGGAAAPTGEAAPDRNAAPGTTAGVRVRAGDGVLTSGLIAAIKRWQTDTGLAVTGTIAVGDVEVLPGAIRVQSVEVQPGSPANAPLMSVTSTRKVITVAAEPADAGSIDRGDRVTVALPDDRTAAARVLAVGRALAPADGDGSPPKLTVTMTVDDPKTIAKLDAADVEVRVAGRTVKDVLAAPVEALVALTEGGYAVQGPHGLVAVRTGMFADGWVEITGAGLTEGTTVVVAS